MSFGDTDSFGSVSRFLFEILDTGSRFVSETCVEACRRKPLEPLELNRTVTLKTGL